MDLPGFGEAPLPEEFAPWHDVLQTMDALGVDRAALVGNSFGGAVALSVAATAPGRVAALVLVSAPPPGLTPTRELQLAWEAEESAFDRGDIDGAVRAVIDAWTLPGAGAELRDRLAGMQRRAFELALAGGDRPEAPDPIETDPEALGALQMPALVAAGELDMADFRTGAEFLARELPRARHVVIAGAGHLAPLEQPEAFQRLVLDFLGQSMSLS